MESDKTLVTALKELKALLDSGAITQEEFEALKKKIIFDAAPASPKSSPTVITQPDLHTAAETGNPEKSIILPPGFERENKSFCHRSPTLNRPPIVRWKR